MTVWIIQKSMESHDEYGHNTGMAIQKLTEE